ncbi:MAG: 23S rRNA methyltransferase, partial [Actinobacteria bacterium]|nr:23S rRNA methyltransferase [Actinomycetota bacterium]
MLADIVPFLRCPHCGEALSLGAGSLSCVRGHNFDVARQGYASLAPGGGGRPRGDTAAMVSEREAFLRAGHLAGLRDEIATIASSSIVTSPFSGEITARSPGGQACVVDAGAGTGYYLAGVLDRRADLVGIALDASKFALRRAARAHPRAAAVGCDVWGSLPVRDKCAALVLDVFAPRNGPEFRRILHPDGRVIVVTPDPNHLRELVARLGLIGVDSHKQRRLAAAFSSSFTLAIV